MSVARLVAHPRFGFVYDQVIDPFLLVLGAQHRRASALNDECHHYTTYEAKDKNLEHFHHRTSFM
jgi:hypothetical protein